MRRWLALFLLILLPLLSAWSVASAYCGGESDARAQHLGHHVDTHHEDGQRGSAGGTATSADCDHCHSPGATMSSFGNATRLIAPQAPVRWTDVALRAPPVALPERPNWARLA